MPVSAIKQRALLGKFLLKSLHLDLSNFQTSIPQSLLLVIESMSKSHDRFRGKLHQSMQHAQEIM